MYTSNIMQIYEQKQKQINETQDAKKILDAFGNLSSEAHNATRFIYELLQNARDQCCDEKYVEVMMKLTKDEFALSHNGKPFKSMDLINIIKQGSNKDRPEKKILEQDEEEVKQPQSLQSLSKATNILNNSLDSVFGRNINAQNDEFDISQLNIPETTGRYGTGLLTTYLLSKHLTVSGILHYDENNENNFRQFSIKLNRDGQTVSQIKQQIKQSFEQLDVIGDTEKTRLLPNYIEGLALDATFSYRLDDETQFDIAASAIKSLLQTAPFILAFNPKFSKITIDDQSSGQFYTLTIDRKPISNHENCCLFNYKENQTLKTILLVNGQYSCVATIVEKDEKGFQNICKISNEIPNIFVDYPLLGSETLGTSIVFNSHFFDPNERRSGIPLSSGIKADQNKFVMKECAKLYEKLVKYILAQRFKGVNNLQINPSDRTDKFLREILVTPCIKIFTENPVVEGQIGFVKLREALFPNIEVPLSDNSKDRLDHLMSLLVILHKQEGNLVKHDYEYIKSWFDILQTQDWCLYFYQDNKKNIKSVVDKMTRSNSTQNFQQQHGMNYQEFQSFMNKFYDYISKYSSPMEIEMHRQSSIFPNQNNHFQPITQMHQDKLENDILKTFAKTYGYDLRGKMLSKDFIIPDNLCSTFQNQSDYSIKLFDIELSNFLKNYYSKYKTGKIMEPNINNFVINDVNQLIEMCFYILHCLPLIEQYPDAQATQTIKSDQLLQQHLNQIEKVKKLLTQLQPQAFPYINLMQSIYKFKEVPIKSQKIAINILLQEIYYKVKNKPNVDDLRLYLLQPNVNPFKFLNKIYKLFQNTAKVHKSHTKLLNLGVIVNQAGNFFKKTPQRQYNSVQKHYQQTIIFNQAFQDNAFVKSQLVDQMIQFYYTFTSNKRHQDEQVQVNYNLNQQVITQYLSYQDSKVLSAQDMCLELDDAIIEKCNDRVVQKQLEKEILMFDDFFLHAFADQKNSSIYFPEFEKMRKTILVDIKQSGELNNQLFEILSQNRESILGDIVNIPQETFDTCQKLVQILSNHKTANKSELILKFSQHIENDQNEVKIRKLIDKELQKKK
eukprot:403348006